MSSARHALASASFCNRRHEAEAAKIALGGLSLLDGKRHSDTTLVVEHAAARGKSRE